MSVSLKDAVKLNYGLQGQLQGAGTPNEAGIGGFIPLRVGTQSVTFLDVLANVNFADYPGYSSIINTTVAGGTISTSTRLGQRWLNGDRSWMYGVNFGYDSRPMPPLPGKLTPLHPDHFSPGGLMEQSDASLQRGGQG